MAAGGVRATARSAYRVAAGPRRSARPRPDAGPPAADPAKHPGEPETGAGPLAARRHACRRSRPATPATLEVGQQLQAPFLKQWPRPTTERRARCRSSAAATETREVVRKLVVGVSEAGLGVVTQDRLALLVGVQVQAREIRVAESWDDAAPVRAEHQHASRARADSNRSRNSSHRGRSMWVRSEPHQIRSNVSPSSMSCGRSWP